MSPSPVERPWESRVEREIRRAQERGEFDRLPGIGRPLPELDRPRDDAWWIRRKLREERFTRLPPALSLRRDVEVARQRITRAGSEDEVRTLVASINAHIRHVNRTIVHGPPSTVMTLDEQSTVQAWRDARARDHRDRDDRAGGTTR